MRKFLLGLVFAVLLAGCGKQVDPVQEQIKLLEDPNSQVRKDAAYKLAEMGDKARVAGPDLIKALKDTDWRVRDGAAFALRGIARKTPGSVRAMLKLLKPEEDWRVARQALLLLAKDEPLPKSAVPELLEGLDSGVPRIRSEAAHALGRMGSDAIDALGRLRASLSDQDPTVQSTVKEAIRRIEAGERDTPEQEEDPNASE